ncbi:MAG TPA: glycosyltransferase [Xanthobacteraceae bacterium]|nr:glycosyltransferase [Xanthobacteraceae bacterium]
MQILINDFIGGVLDRGMPLYVRNLIDGLREEGFGVRAIRAPAICRKLPRNLFYVFAILVEQFFLPLMSLVWRADLTLYPYNSVSVIDLLRRRGRIVVHDLEQLNRPMSPSKAYYLACYRAIRWLNRPVFTISKLSRERLSASELFGHGAITILPNTFYAFERFAAAADPPREPKTSILLCSGSTANKDLETVIGSYLPQVLAAGYRVAILGLHKANDAARFAPLDTYLRSGQLRMLGQLTDAEVAAEYRKHEIVWVHSLREGFGRCVVEGRLAGGRVICTDIPEFAELRDADVHLYADANAFMTTLDDLVQADTPIGSYTAYPYRALLRSAIQSGL